MPEKDLGNEGRGGKGREKETQREGEGVEQAQEEGIMLGYTMKK
jgi:hypothetical protein